MMLLSKGMNNLTLQDICSKEKSKFDDLRDQYFLTISSAKLRKDFQDFGKFVSAIFSK